MNVRSALREAIEQLTASQVPSASTTAEVLLLFVLGRDRAFLYTYPEAELTLEQERAYRHLVAERAAGKPTQYLTGEQEFWGLNLHVRAGVFIPRPETEHVVEVALALVRERLRRPSARIVDVGTGTGCIALALASELAEAEIFATDTDPAALALAQENAHRLELGGRVHFVQCDLLSFFLEAEKGDKQAVEHFDLVVSNPPYVSPEEAAQLPREVREYEPAGALFAGEEGLGVTRRLVEQAGLLLVPGGWLVLELGYQMAQRMRALFGDDWTGIEITNDLRGIPRVLAAQRRN